MFGMSWLGWVMIAVLFMIVFVGWIGREIPPTDYKNGRKKKLCGVEELERRE